MKKLLIMFVTLSVATVALSQNRNENEKIKVDFYGIDFSDVNVICAKETSAKFIDAFERINELLIVEQSKYDFAKYFGLDVVSIDYGPAIKQIKVLNDVKFKDKQHSNIDITSIVSKYPNNDNNGLIVIAKELNKRYNRGIFIVVIYDGKTKNILLQQELLGKAGGFGLRNYWAGALYSGLKSMKYFQN